jgi:hypothetical protein
MRLNKKRRGDGAGEIGGGQGLSMSAPTWREEEDEVGKGRPAAATAHWRKRRCDWAWGRGQSWASLGFHLHGAAPPRVSMPTEWKQCFFCWLSLHLHVTESAGMRDLSIAYSDFPNKLQRNYRAVLDKSAYWIRFKMRLWCFVFLMFFGYIFLLNSLVLLWKIYELVYIGWEESRRRQHGETRCASSRTSLREFPLPILCLNLISILKLWFG